MQRHQSLGDRKIKNGLKRPVWRQISIGSLRKPAARKALECRSSRGFPGASR